MTPYTNTRCNVASGTTGNPKGVVLTNGNVLSSVGSAYKFFDSYDLTFKDEDCFLSFLPLSHIYAQQSEALFIGKAGYIGYYSGNIKLLASDLAALKPTVFCGVRTHFHESARILLTFLGAESLCTLPTANWRQREK